MNFRHLILFVDDKWFVIILSQIGRNKTFLENLEEVAD